MGIEIKFDGRILTLKMKDPLLDGNSLKNSFEILQEKGDQSSLVVFDFLDVKEVTTEAILLLNVICGVTDLRRSRTAFLAKEKLQASMKLNGFSEKFFCYPDISSATQRRALELHHEAVDFLHFAREATFLILRSAANCKAQSAEMYKRGEGPNPKTDIAGIVGIVNGTYQGTLVLGFEITTFLSLIGHIHSKKYDVLTPDIHDGAAEILNLVIHRATASYGFRGTTVKQTMTKFIMGKELNVFSEKTPSLIVPFHTEMGNLSLELGLCPPDPKLLYF